MRILHTGDWHLGKYLEGVSRIEEQERFLEDFVDLVEEEAIDIVIQQYAQDAGAGGGYGGAICG